MGDTNKICAVIEIGSNSIFFKIAQRKGAYIEVLENVEYNLSLGKDSFAKGKIEFEKVIKTSELIEEFIEMAKGYGVRIKDIKVVATTAVREAKNRDYIIDQIMVRTGVKLHVLDDLEEKLYMYREIMRQIKDIEELKKETILISYIGSGSLGIALYKNGSIIFAQNILIGTLKLSEILGNLKYRTDKLYVVIEEYMTTFTKMLARILPVNEINTFVVSGSGIKFLRSQCNFEKKGNLYNIGIPEFMDIYNNIKDKNPEQIEKIYEISEERAEILLPSMGIYKALIGLTNSKNIISPSGDLLDSIVYSLLFENEKEEIDKIVEESTILTAKNIAERYFYDKEHADFVEKNAIKIFDKMKKFHGMGDRERLYLRIAAILHDIGKYMNIKNHYKHSYNIINASDIMGLNERETSIVANIARYHSRELPSEDNRGYRILTNEDKVLVSKLTAIIRIADALDRSHAQKVEEMEISFKGNELVVTVSGSSAILIDEWTFVKKSAFMQEVFGVKTIIKKRGRDI
jgi:exopolyphosphatase / guanosine-5'-triphosphate,3'-diphosphate pyrophosphatase